MKIKDIDAVILVLEKIKKPSSPIIRRKVFSILAALKKEQSIQEEMKKSYVTDAVKSIEQQKYDFIKRLHKDDGKISIGEFRVDDMAVIKVKIDELEAHADYQALKLYNSYMDENYPIREFININETDDEMFQGLTEEEISHLMLIIE